MVLVIEIVLGLATLIIDGLFIVAGYNEFTDGEGNIEIGILSILYGIFIVISVIMGLILITGNIEYATEIIIDFLNTEL